MEGNAVNGRQAPRVAIVTGAAHGIGLAAARHLLKAGAAVLVSDLDESGLESGAGRLEAADGTLITHVGDLSSARGAQAVIDAAMEWRGRVDVLVNNAGGGVIRAFLDHDESSIAETISRNLMTTIHCCRAVIPIMIAQGGGRIVNVGAESVRNGLLAHAMYNGAKGGVHGLTSGLAREFAPAGITVNCVAPSITATEVAQPWIDDPDSVPAPLRPVLDQAIGLIPVGRAAAMDEVAATIAFLASDAASFITGQVVSVNGGSSMQ